MTLFIHGGMLILFAISLWIFWKYPQKEINDLLDIEHLAQ